MIDPNQKYSPLISVITVCFNSASVINDTIESVLNQKYDNIEYIVIDGDSTDGTIEILKSFAQAFEDKNIAYNWISEKDGGIYEAMNKGIKRASGEWLNFMNAGDLFFDSGVLNKLSPYLSPALALVYGSKIQHGEIIVPHPIQTLEKGLIMACHQSMFFNKAKLKDELMYDCQYKIYGDYELVNKIYLKYTSKILYVNHPVSIFQGGGISEKPSFQKRKDKYLILYRTYGLIGLVRALFYRFFEHKKTFGLF